MKTGWKEVKTLIGRFVESRARSARSQPAKSDKVGHGHDAQTSSGLCCWLNILGLPRVQWRARLQHAGSTSRHGDNAEYPNTAHVIIIATMLIINKLSNHII